MTVTVELRPEVEARVAAQAAAQGVSVETYIQIVLENLASAPEGVVQTATTAQERAQRWQEWVDSRSSIKAPPLSDEAISRESIYGEREDSQL